MDSRERAKNFQSPLIAGYIGWMASSFFLHRCGHHDIPFSLVGVMLDNGLQTNALYDVVVLKDKAPFGGRAESDRAGRGNGPFKSRAAKGCKRRTNVLGCDV